MWQRFIPPGILLISVTLVGHRVWRTATIEYADHAGMPRAVSTERQRAIYLVPGGRYTEADIAANGSLPATQRYSGFEARHDFRPEPGDRLCPVTRTKANSGCTWVIGGQMYQFCCPPCIDEFVRLAKEQPEAIEPPSAYVAQPVPADSPRPLEYESTHRRGAD
jgi:hypothetical protein